VWFHPELLDWWREAQEEAGIRLGEGNWMVGFLYRWSYYDEFEANPELYDDLVQGELFALTVGAVMYDPIWRTAQ
jgi:8-oxo-dGTP pyrophosphatase MutT (NUDIX family)